MKAVPSLCWVLTPESMLAESTVWGLMIYSLDDLQLEALCLLGVDLRPLVENMLMLALPVFFCHRTSSFKVVGAVLSFAFPFSTAS